MKFVWCNNAGVGNESPESVSTNHTRRRGMVLPFEPLSITFNEIRYAVDMPQVSFNFLYGAKMLRGIFIEVFDNFL